MTLGFVHCSLAPSDLNEHTVSRELHLDGVRDVQTAVSGCNPCVGLIDERSMFSPCISACLRLLLCWPTRCGCTVVALLTPRPGLLYCPCYVSNFRDSPQAVILISM